MGSCQSKHSRSKSKCAAQQQIKKRMKLTIPANTTIETNKFKSADTIGIVKNADAELHLKGENVVLQKERSRLDAECKRLHGEKSSAEKKVRVLVQQLEDISIANKETTNRMKNQVDKKVQAELRLVELQAKIDGESKKNSQLKQDNNNLRKSLKEKSQLIKELSSKYERLEKDRKETMYEMKQTIASLKEQLGASEKKKTKKDKNSDISTLFSLGEISAGKLDESDGLEVADFQKFIEEMANEVEGGFLILHPPEFGVRIEKEAHLVRMAGVLWVETSETEDAAAILSHGGDEVELKLFSEWSLLGEKRCKLVRGEKAVTMSVSKLGKSHKVEIRRIGEAANEGKADAEKVTFDIEALL